MKSRVRVWVTYGAALYVFLFGAILCGLLLWLGSDATGMAEAKDLFLATLPIGSGILAYWFAARGRSSSGDVPVPVSWTSRRPNHAAFRVSS